MNVHPYTGTGGEGERERPDVAISRSASIMPVYPLTGAVASTCQQVENRDDEKYDNDTGEGDYHQEPPLLVERLGQL